MTGRTARQHAGRLDVIFRGKRLALLGLILGRFPLHIRDVFGLPQNRFRIAMALQTPLHLQRRGVPHQRHQVHPAVTTGTSHALVDVYAVIEIGEIREVMDSRPFDWLTGPPTLPHDLEVWTVRK